MKAYCQIKKISVSFGKKILSCLYNLPTLYFLNFWRKVPRILENFSKIRVDLLPSSSKTEKKLLFYTEASVSMFPTY